MPLPIDQFYNNDKSIQRSYNFYVTIINDDSGRSYLPEGKPMPVIEDYHVVNITLPQWAFKKEIQYYGPYARTFPVLEHEGFELKLTFEEDDKGTIAKFIDWMQKRIIINDGSGRYVPPARNRIESIVVRSVEFNGITNVRWFFSNCYFLRASEPTFDYGTNETIKYEIAFGCDFQKFDGIEA